MQHKRPEQKVVMDLVDVTCDRCAESCWEHLDNVEALRLKANWGYGSRWDGQEWSAELCQNCAQELRAWIDAGAGPGVLVERSFGDIERADALNILQHNISAWTGMALDEYLESRAKGSDLSHLPEAHRADYWARFL
jgi:hypothetical protein